MVGVQMPIKTISLFTIEAKQCVLIGMFVTNQMMFGMKVFQVCIDELLLTQ